MNLAEQQRALARLIRGEPLDASTDDAYLRRIAASPYLGLAREVVQWWKSYRIERFCPLTSALLKRLERFEEEACRFEPEGTNHHYIENVGMAFLSHMGGSGLPLVASVARFEYAFIKVRLGDDADYVVEWDQNPAPVLNALLQQTPLPEQAEGEYYKIHLSRHLPESFEIVMSKQ